MPAIMHHSDRMHRSNRQLHRARRLARRYRAGTPYPPPPGVSITNRSPAATVTESHPRTGVSTAGTGAGAPPWMRRACPFRGAARVPRRWSQMSVSAGPVATSEALSASASVGTQPSRCMRIAHRMCAAARESVLRAVRGDHIEATRAICLRCVGIGCRRIVPGPCRGLTRHQPLVMRASASWISRRKWQTYSCSGRASSADLDPPGFLSRAYSYATAIPIGATSTATPAPLAGGRHGYLSDSARRRL